MSTYGLVSLPVRVFEATDDSLLQLQSVIGDAGHVLPLPIPNFKIGTLDSLVSQADELAKLAQVAQAVAGKVAESLKSILDGDESKIEQQKVVNDRPTDAFVTSFQWNRARYRADKSIAELVDMLQQELNTTDNDVKIKLQQYNSIKTNLAAVQRRQSGNLLTKSLATVVDPALLIHDSEYMESHLIAVPINSKKEFIQSYETIAPMVVPRSATEIAADAEFVLYAVVTFKKTSAEFLHKCREQKWTPRQYKYTENGRQEEQQEADRLTAEERKVWGESLRMARSGWSETLSIWMHVLVLRVFVEAVLRYGLPLDYVHGLIQTPASKGTKKLRTALEDAYAYRLAGNDMSRDKKGKVTKDDAQLTSEMAAAGYVSTEGNEYTPYVYYELSFP